MFLTPVRIALHQAAYNKDGVVDRAPLEQANAKGEASLFGTVASQDGLTVAYFSKHQTVFSENFQGYIAGINKGERAVKPRSGSFVQFIGPPVSSVRK